ncbi:MAG: DUF1343 domain-containing protein [Pseudomonadota bacterium]
MKLGIDQLLSDAGLKSSLQGRRIALLAHPASMTAGFMHSIDALMDSGLNLTAAFGPQHGMRGDKQDNMVETVDDFDAKHGLPVFSLYGKVRRPTSKMLDHFDVILVDVQDVGCRIYTFLTTLCYLLEDCATAGKGLWVLDRPNPAGRSVEGLKLTAGFESFVGAGPLPMRHGMTLGELARWYVDLRHLDLEFKVVPMQGYDPAEPPGFGWPTHELAWVNPSPNMAGLNAARAYAGTVMLEGTTLSEGRGTTRPLELVGAPDIEIEAILDYMYDAAPQWLAGVKLRPCFFQPTFHKYKGKLCRGFQLHTDHPAYDHAGFRPYRLVALFLKAVHTLHLGYKIWRDFEYEYVEGPLPIDTINGGPALRHWVEAPGLDTEAFEQRLKIDEQAWDEERAPYLLY